MCTTYEPKLVKMGVMDTSEFESYLQDIEAYVIDENKVVTYKWLSKYLGIHINTAKQLLYSFATQQGNKVHSTYLVSGQLKNDEGVSVQIAREEDLQRMKEQFKVVTSEHVYSVQKVKKLQDLNILYTVDVYKISDTYDSKRLGSIICNGTVLRSQEIVATLKQQSQSSNANENDKQWPATRKQFASEANKNEGSTSKLGIESGESKERNGTKVQNDLKNKTKRVGIAAMFAAQNTKSKKQAEIEPKTENAENKKQKSGSGISAFFSRQVNKQSILSNKKHGSENSSQESSNEMECESVTSPTNKNAEGNVKSKQVDVEKEAVLKDSKKAEKISKKNKGATKKERSRDKSPPTKRRKRIVVMSDSEESDETELANEEEDERMCCSPPPQPQLPESDGEDIIPPTPDAGLKKGRKRIRKLVDKTYMDEDGYMLTCKEYVTESCSGSELEEEKENENKSKDNSDKLETESPRSNENSQLSPKEKTSPQKTKQASIMNFFKKK